MLLKHSEACGHPRAEQDGRAPKQDKAPEAEAHPRQASTQGWRPPKADTCTTHRHHYTPRQAQHTTGHTGTRHATPRRTGGHPEAGRHQRRADRHHGQAGRRPRQAATHGRSAAEAGRAHEACGHPKPAGTRGQQAPECSSTEQRTAQPHSMAH